MFHERITCLVEVKDGDQGQGLVEYAMILLFVALAAIAALMLFGVPLNAMFTRVTDAF